MDKNHCGKCCYLKRAKKPKLSEHGRHISCNGTAPFSGFGLDLVATAVSTGGPIEVEIG